MELELVCRKILENSKVAGIFYFPGKLKVHLCIFRYHRVMMMNVNHVHYDNAFTKQQHHRYHARAVLF